MCKKFSILTLLLSTLIFLNNSFATDLIEVIPEKEEIITETTTKEIEKLVEPTESIEQNMEPMDATINNEISEEEVDLQIKEDAITELEETINLEDEIGEEIKTDITKNAPIEETENILHLDTEFKKEITDEELEKVLERIENGKTASKIEEMRLSDIIGTEEISEELKYKIKQMLNTAQQELDNYRSTMKSNYRTMTRKLLDVKKELNRVQNFKDEAEYDLEVSRWMILTLSMGVICLTFLIVIMWRSVTNIGKNEIEVLFAYEDLKKNIGKINEQIDLLTKKNTIAKEEANPSDITNIENKEI
jgi:hypothetical protein